MKILINTTPLLFRKTGIGYYIENLYKRLISFDNIEVIPSLSNNSKSFLNFLIKISQIIRGVLGEKIFKVKFSSYIGDFLIEKLYCKNMDKIDIYHETNYDQFPKGEFKKVANIYDLTFIKFPDLLPDSIVKKCKENLNNILTADRFIVNTFTIKNEIMSLLDIPSEKIDVIPLAPASINKKMFFPYIDNSLIDKDYILFVGTIEPRKNLLTLINAFSLIRKKYDIKLVIVGGKGWLYKEILELPYKLKIQDHIIFKGYVDEKKLLNLYRHAFVFVFPSLYEGFGLPLVEAMNFQVPIIASDIKVFREIAKDAALYFNPMDIEDLAFKIENILNSEKLRQILIKKSEKLIKRYTWEKVVNMTIDTYFKTLKMDIT